MLGIRVSVGGGAPTARRRGKRNQTRQTTGGIDTFGGNATHTTRTIQRAREAAG